MVILLIHLLKGRFQPARRGPSWENTVREQRRAIARLIARHPSLVPNLDQARPKAYVAARLAASRETGLPVSTFPSTCPYTLCALLDAGAAQG